MSATPQTRCAREASRFDARTVWPLALLLAVFGGCARRADEERLNPAVLGAIAAPSPEPSGGPCTDIGTHHRVCWSPACAGGLCVRSRPLPPEIERAPLGYRCTGVGSARKCAARSARAASFQCRGKRCTQEQPRLPDDGEWECADLSGAVLCRGGSEPAAVVHVSADPGWWCGSRRRARNGERVCLDLDPDLPEKPAIRACHYELEGARTRRVCEHTEQTLLGDACTHSDLCPPGSECQGGICLPPKPSPDCWGDADCGLGQCRFGTCSQGAP